MVRPPLVLVVFIVLGAALSFAIAWGLALAVDPNRGTRTSSGGFISPKGCWSMSASHAWGTDFYVSQRYAGFTTEEHIS